MKKLITFLMLTVAVATGMSAQSYGYGKIGQMDVATFVKTLDNVNGFFFIGVGEDRDLSLTLDREPNNALAQEDVINLHWVTINPDIASIQNLSSGIILSGNNYGETIVSSEEYDNEGNLVDKNNYIVFVCPKITIVSPEGAIYSYHKVYNQPTRLQLTQSNDYMINNVVRIDNATGQRVDVTDRIDKATGWYNSDEVITDDTTFWVAMEKRPAVMPANDVVADSNAKVYVEGTVTRFDPPSAAAGKRVKITDTWGNVLFNQAWPANGELDGGDNNVGVFTLEVQNGSTYKIIAQPDIF